MALHMDPEILAKLPKPAPGGHSGPPVGDVDSRRSNLAAGMAALAASRAPVPGVERTDFVVASDDGAELGLSWYQHATAEQPGSAVLFLHGGGFIVPLLPVYDGMMRAYTAATGVPMLIVDYRVAPEHPHPTPVEDCYTALCWLADNAASLGVDPHRIAGDGGERRWWTRRRCGTHGSGSGRSGTGTAAAHLRDAR